MKYSTNPVSGEKLSRLGLGCMRFPRTGSRIDQEKTNELVDAAIKKGVNFFDTAYIYPGSEEALGKALRILGAREKVNIGTKLPHYTCKKTEDIDRIFNSQLKRLQTDYVDYYFMHMLSNIGSWERLKAFGIIDWIKEKRSTGVIRNIGFSFHGGRDSFIELLDAYKWEFCMVQYNYYDENNQASSVGVRAAFEKGLPVIAMEPLLGGTLVNGLPNEAIQAFGKVSKERSLADWAFRWLLNQQEVTIALSGISNLAELTENCAIVDDCEPEELSEEESTAYKTVVAVLSKSMKVKCTGCGYCMPCPKGVDIPTCFSAYNARYAFGFIDGMSEYVQNTGLTTPKQSDASKCVSCGICEKHCPQSISIAKELKKVNQKMLGSILKPMFFIARKILKI